MKNYYFILGVTIYANESDIKQAYRKLALQFHPDRNPSPEAEAIFKEINEAYETLGDRNKKTSYDLLLRGIAPAASTYTKPHRDPRYRPRPPGSFSRKSKRQELLEVMNDYLRYALFSSRVALVFAVVLVLDFSLPKNKTQQQVISTSFKRELRGGGSFQLNLQDGEVLNLSRTEVMAFNKGTSVFIYRSSWFDIPMKVENEKTSYQAKIPVAIYGNFIFCPLVMIITSLLGSFYWKGVEFRFNLGIVNFFLTLLSLLFLRIHLF